MNAKRATEVLAVLALVALVVRAEDKPAPKIVSAHFIEISENTYPNDTEVHKFQHEVWIKGDSSRNETLQLGSKYSKNLSILLSVGEMHYSYAQGKTHGFISTLPPQNITILDRLEEIKKKGRKVGVEAVLGVDCEKYEQEFNYKKHISKRIYWISRANHFPVMATLEVNIQNAAGKSSETTIYKNIEINPDLPDSLFVPPNNVTFTPTK